MDPLDPLTEIVKSGQGFSPSIALERILWVMMGFFFLGAILTSMIKGLKQVDWFDNNAFLFSSKSAKRKDKLSNKSSDND
ncbi:possible Legume lectins alpha domain [Prochlorococcus marinus str. MIT 9515]|uniref:Possible Legume lectins alpha domain n=1 Tax=Prochlorococcus marinus (strain MIT 9515) TaxID=167542 RepID=A2BWY6_PROM5|nr:hypothetical protein [Prochlorococcus marinus]ABM72297.1 possible Legume lectins alpha domain [Prochlorococcus marinus str. MIT 9515]